MTSADDWAAVFYDLARGRSVAFPGEWTPGSFHEGLDIQLRVLDRWEKDGYHLGGWKVGLTSGNGRKKVPEGYRPFGYILRERIFRSGSPISLADFAGCEIEPEVCVTINEALYGDVTESEVRSAAGPFTASWEINDWRSAGRPLPFRMADDLGQWGIVVGEEATGDVRFDGITVAAEQDGHALGETTRQDVPDDPFVSISRLCRTLAEFGLGLDPGQRVITGSFAHYKVAAPGRWNCRFGGIGLVAVAFEE